MKNLFSTKYALTAGIQTFEAKGEHFKKDDYVYQNDGYRNQFVFGRNCFESIDEAIADAEAQRKKKIQSLLKQIEKLEALKFEVE